MAYTTWSYHSGNGELPFKENHPAIHHHFTLCKTRLCRNIYVKGDPEKSVRMIVSSEILRGPERFQHSVN